MATTTQPFPAGDSVEETYPVTGPAANESALVSSSVVLEQGGSPGLDPKFAPLAIELDVAIPLREFRVRDLLGLERERVLTTRWAPSEDLPLAAGKTQLAWCEFEVVDSKLAVRLTRLA